MTALVLSMWLAGVALAQEAAEDEGTEAGGGAEPTSAAAPESSPPAESPPPPETAVGRSYDRALQLALDLERAGDPGAARALAGWVADQPDVGLRVDDAAALVQRLPAGPSLLGYKVRLIGFEAAAGAYLLGANPIDNELYGDEGIPYIFGALLGGGAGTLGAIYTIRRPGFSADRFDAIVGSQQLGAFNLAMLAAAYEEGHDTDRWLVPTGLGIGAFGGTGLGWWWAEHGPHPVSPVAMRSGGFWGIGLTLVGLSATYSWNKLDQDTLYLALVAGTDVGAAAGYALPYLLPVTREQVRFANLGGVVGAASAYFFAYTTADLIWYMPHDVAMIVGGAGVAGGALGVLLATRLEHAPDMPLADAMFRTENGRLRIALPVPHPTVLPGPEPRLGLGVSIVDQSF